MNAQFPIGKLDIVANPSPEQFAEWLGILSAAPAQYQAVIATAHAAKWHNHYREGSWTALQVLHHVCDSHMMGLYRIKQALTEENSIFTGYARDLWVQGADYQLPAEVSGAMLGAIHHKMVMLLKTATPEQLQRTSERVGQGKQNLMQMAQLYAWHSQHHLQHITITLLQQVQ